jgi:hypothetical protein
MSVSVFTNTLFSFGDGEIAWNGWIHGCICSNGSKTRLVKRYVEWQRNDFRKSWLN